MSMDDFAEAAIDAVEYLPGSIGLPACLDEIGGAAKDISKLAESTMSLQRLIGLSPRRPSQQDIEQILIESLSRKPL
jgi:alcohol dehydrogenase class IV